MIPYGYFYRLTKLTGLSEKALDRRFTKAVHNAAARASEDQS